MTEIIPPTEDEAQAHGPERVVEELRSEAAVRAGTTVLGRMAEQTYAVVNERQEPPAVIPPAPKRNARQRVNVQLQRAREMRRMRPALQPASTLGETQ